LKNNVISNPDQAVIVALGSNMPGPYGSSRKLLEAALEAFEPHGLRVIARSGWWRSVAWPDPTAPAYTNGVAIVETRLGAVEVMGALHAVELAFGRERGAANASRTLDLDLVAYGREVGVFEGVELPHPRAAERLFVMGPLSEIAPGWAHPVTGESARALAQRASVGTDARPPAP
jgi:2-amino-4-hydroxy-6-hydroxymethyldihydropteridine diphosphokinase